MRRYADLHVHSSRSDGILSPEEVVKRAVAMGLRVIALADHDTVSGYEEARSQAIGSELEVVPAVELSTASEGMEIHILGYLINHEDSVFVRRIEEFRKDRHSRGERIVEKLNELGIELSMETVLRVAGGSPLGRPHVADALVQEEFVRSFDEAFARFLGYHAPAYVPKQHIGPEEGIRLIHDAQGVAVLAHPGTLGRDDLIQSLVESGLDGIEAIHPLHDNRTTLKYQKLTEQYGIIFTGGSDSHGRKTDKVSIGGITVPKECYENLLRAKERYAA
jgi:hypothetical protein